MKKILNKKTAVRKRRHARIRSTVRGTKDFPRLAVFRSNKYIYAQLIDDISGTTLLSASDITEKSTTPKLERAKKVGAAVASAAKDKKITKVVFDRGGFLYAGRVKALADAAREGGLSF